MEEKKLTTLSKTDYLKNPCRTSSIPFWKTKEISVPDTMKIVHDMDFVESFLQNYHDEPYFRIIHTLHNLTNFTLPEAFSFCSASVEEFTDHINHCYNALHISSEELHRYTMHSVYCPDLWVTIRDNRSGIIVASGIGELDSDLGEGMLEWIQVSEDYRSNGLGSCIVLELLRRMKGKVNFVTVSGSCNNPTNPEALYRKCGFVGNDIWHILEKR